MVSTSVLINSMRNIIHGIKNVSKFRLLLNDLYMERVKCNNKDNNNNNPSPREIIEGALECISEDDLDMPLGNSSIDLL